MDQDLLFSVMIGLHDAGPSLCNWGRVVPSTDTILVGPSRVSEPSRIMVNKLSDYIYVTWGPSTTNDSRSYVSKWAFHVHGQQAAWSHVHCTVCSLDLRTLILNYKHMKETYKSIFMPQILWFSMFYSHKNILDKVHRKVPQQLALKYYINLWIL